MWRLKVCFSASCLTNVFVSRGPLNNLLMLSLYYVSWTTFQKFVTSEKHEPDGSTEYMGASVNSSGIYLINCLNYIQCLNWGGAAGSQTPIKSSGTSFRRRNCGHPCCFTQENNNTMLFSSIYPNLLKWIKSDCITWSSEKHFTDTGSSFSPVNKSKTKSNLWFFLK